MTQNRGTFEGNIQEIELVKLFNQKDSKNFKIFKCYYEQFGDKNLDNIFLCRVTTKQYSKLSSQIVMTRSDAYAIEIENDINSILQKNDYYLDENILSNNKINYKKIAKSGISIKMQDSNKFQIIKLTPNSFTKLFQNTELGAGASLFCKRESELEKNLNLLNGWHTSIEKMCKYYNTFNLSENFIYDIQKCKTIKQYAEHKICDIINNSDYLQQIIFNGINIYEEPYCAYYLFKNGILDKLTYLPFNVTTGSGRSKGIYTIVLKPV